jgi:hypothetical protein
MMADIRKRVAKGDWGRNQGIVGMGGRGARIKVKTHLKLAETAADIREHEVET